MIKEDATQESVETETTNAEKMLVDISKRMMSKYVEDKFSEQIDKEDFDKIIDNIDIRFVERKSDTTHHEHHENAGGYYNPYTKTITIYRRNEEVIEEDSIPYTNIGTIIHETSHLLSDLYSEGNPISPFFEEGMADVFSEECINYFVQFATKEEQEQFNIKKDSKVSVAASSYYQERNFVKTTLDVIRKRSGKAKEAEFEYFLGNKDNFKMLCKEALGEEFLELLETQKGDYNLAEHATREYNARLMELIEKMDQIFEYEPTTEDGEWNVYANEDTLLSRLENRRAFNERANKFYEAAIEDGSYEGLMKLKEKDAIHDPDLIKRLAESNVYSNIDLIKYISTFENIKFEDYAYLLDKDKILSEDFNNVDARSRKTLLSMLMKSDQTDERNLDIIKKIEESALLQVEQEGKELTDEEKLLTIRCKYLSSVEHKGERLTAMLDILQDKNINVDDYALDFCELLKQDMEDYLKNYAKEDAKGKEKLVEFFDGFEGKQVDGDYYDPISDYCKITYYSQIYEDLSQIKTVMNLESEFKQEVYDKGHYSGKGKYIPMQGLTLETLARVEQDTVLIDVFDKQNVKDVMEISSISKSFPTLSDEQKSIVLDVIDDMKSEPEYMTDLLKIEDYTRSMLAEETNPNITQRKQNILSSINDKLNEREKPLDDISRLLNRYEENLSNSSQYICSVLIDKVQADLESEKMEDVSMEKLADIVAKASDKEGAEYIQAVTAKLLTSVMGKKQFTTQGLLDEIASYDPSIKHDILIQSYLESIGKGEDKTQKDLLPQLDRLEKEGVHITNPQYITYQDKEGEERHIILLNGDESLEAYSTSGLALNSNQELMDAQNKRKKGLFSIFKSKKEKEMISRTVVISEATEDNKESQILNIYENGRIEIATMESDGKHKITSREDIETFEIGRNAALIPQKEKTQLEVDMADMVVGDNEYQYETDNKKAPTKDQRDDLNI